MELAVQMQQTFQIPEVMRVSILQGTSIPITIICFPLMRMTKWRWWKWKLELLIKMQGVTQVNTSICSNTKTICAIFVMKSTSYPQQHQQHLCLWDYADMFTGYFGALSEYKRCSDGILRCPACRRPARDIICHGGGRNIGNDEPIMLMHGVTQIYRNICSKAKAICALNVKKATSYMKQNQKHLTVWDYDSVITATKLYQNTGDILLVILDVPHAGVLLEISYIMKAYTMGVSQVYKNARAILRITLSSDLPHLCQPSVIGLWVHFH